MELSHDLLGVHLRAGDAVLMETRSQLLVEKLPRPEVEELVLEEVPDVTYADVGGLDSQIEAITDAVELPVPAPRPVQRVQAARAQGHPALRAARVRQDPHRQGGGQLAGQEGGRRSRATPTSGATSSTSRARSCSTSTSARPSARSGWCSSAPGRRPRRASPSSSSSTRWTRCSAPGARASAPTSSPPSCPSCWPRSTASRRCATSSSSAPRTVRTSSTRPSCVPAAST